MYKNIILSKIFDYCKAVNWPIKKMGSVVMLDCPICKSKMSANIIPNQPLINCFKCHEKFNLIDVVENLVEEMSEKSEDEILEYIKKTLNLDIATPKEVLEIEKILTRYEKEGFCIVPCAKKDKNPVQDEWQNKENKDRKQWEDWLASGLNIGVRTGRCSNLTILDLDLLSKDEKIALILPETSEEEKQKILAKKVIPNKIREIMGETLIQETLGGFHLFYKYVNLPKARVLIKEEGYEFYIDLENDGGQVIVCPAPATAVDKKIPLLDEKNEPVLNSKGEPRTIRKIYGYAPRKFINDNAIIEIPTKMMEFLLTYVKTKEEKTDASISEDISTSNKIENHKLELLEDGDGRNNFFTALGGALRHKMPISSVNYALKVVDKMICKHPLGSEIDIITDSLDKYASQDLQRLEKEIIEYLDMAQQATKSDIEIAIYGKKVTGDQKKKFDCCLNDLIEEKKIVKIGNTYKLIKAMVWKDTITDVGVPIKFKMPYFENFAHFNLGDILILAGVTKAGKTSLAMNIIKRLVDQGIKPYYIYTENGARYAKTAMKLGMKDKDFYRCYCDNIRDVQFPKGGVVVWDWIDPPDFAKTNLYFSEICTKIEEAQGILIGLMQLKESQRENGKNLEPEWFAKNLVRQKCALAVKFLHESSDGILGKFVLTDVRDPKPHGRNFIIPTTYNRDTAELKTVEELNQEQKEAENGKKI